MLDAARGVDRAGDIAIVKGLDQNHVILPLDARTRRVVGDVDRHDMSGAPAICRSAWHEIFSCGVALVL